MSAVTVATDSTAYLPPELLEAHRIASVSLSYRFGNGDSVREADMDGYASFYEQLRDSTELPVTMPPPVEDLVAAYKPLLMDGGSVVSIHISSAISDTCANARKAADQLREAGAGGERINVLDSASAGGQTALVVLAAACAVASGKDADEVAEVARQARLEAKGWWLMDTLEYLKRGGRISSAAAWIGSTLKVKPILTFESEIKAVERVRTRERGLERIVDYGRQLHGAGRDAWVLQHANCPGDAGAVAQRLQEVFWRPPEHVSELGAVVGTHTGPGLIGVAGIASRFLE